MQLEGRELHTRRGLKKKLCSIYNLSPQEKLLVFFNIAECMRSGHRNCSVTEREKPLSFKTEVYLLLSMLSENCLWSDLKDFLLRPYAATERKPNVSLADLIRCCPFT